MELKYPTLHRRLWVSGWVRKRESELHDESDLQPGALLDALLMAGNVVASRTPKPVLQCVKLTAEDNTLTLAATDLEVAIRYNDAPGADRATRGGPSAGGQAAGHRSRDR